MLRAGWSTLFLGVASCVDAGHVRLVAGRSDTVIVNSRRPVPLPVRLVDANGVEHRARRVRFQLIAGDIELTRDGRVTCGRPGDARLRQHLESLLESNSGEAYGVPKIQMELQEGGQQVNHKRIARLMRGAGLQGITRRRFQVTTQRDPAAVGAADLVDRAFVATAPNQLWVADITYIPTWAGFLYLAIVLDVFSRRIVGWAMQATLETSVVLDALNMAIGQRQPTAVIHHSDHGCQYTSVQFGKRCREVGVRPSMGSVGDCYDNAMAESFFATLECELLARRRFKSHAEARIAIFAFIEGWYNPRRRHSSLGRISPLRFEQKHQESMAA